MKKFDMKKWIVENKYGKSPSYSNYSETRKPINEELATAAAGFVALVSAAGGLAALQMKMESPEAREKNPKLATFLDILDALGSAASSAKRGGSVAGGVNEQEEDESFRFEKGEEEGGDDIDVDKIEDELENIFDIPGDNCPVEEE